MSPTAPVVAIVDGYASGNFLPPAFAELGARVVHVQSTPELMTSMLLPDMAQYEANIVGDEDELVRQLGELNPVAIVAGQEPGVPMADRLSERLGVPSNGSRLSLARRDKYEMIEALRAADVNCAQQLKSSSPQALVDWAVERGEYPVVVKPLSSASTDNVYICDDADAVRTAAEKVLAARDIFNLPNEEALIQSYLDGVEYAVDTVSHDGHRFVVAVWRYEKDLVNGKMIYDKDVLVPADESPIPELIAYVDSVHEALNIRYGPTHTEVKMTSNGPALVEIGARINGGLNPGFQDECLGHNQVDLYALSYLDPEKFLKEYGDRAYEYRQPATLFTCPTSLTGTVVAINQEVLQEINALPTVFLSVVKVQPGGRVRRTTDLLSSPLRVFLTGDTESAILEDYARVKELKDKVFEL